MTLEAIVDLDIILIEFPENPAALSLKEKLISTSLSCTSLNSPNNAEVLQSEFLCDKGSEWEVEALRRAARDHLSNGRSEEAVIALEKAICICNSYSGTSSSIDNALSSILLLLSSAYSSLNDDMKVIYTCGLILDKSPKHFKALIRRAEAYYRKVISRDSNIFVSQINFFHFY